ncbi:MAG TPA: serine/threonine-protein kinase [Kofleriaceae bacterium]
MLGHEIANYRLIDQLGEGGMGRVYLAVDRESGRRVAIKVLAREHAESAEIVQRFLGEARTIRHAHVVEVLDAGRLPDGTPYIVMELVEGRSLRAFVQRGAMPLDGLAHVVGQVLDALAATHANGIVHRDLKPDNIMITAAGDAKLVDFGVAKIAGNQVRTRTGVAIGTPEYMAPEQIRGGVIDGRTDLYSLGVVMYELATGVRPFEAASDFDMMEQHLRTEPLDARERRPELSEPLWNVIRRAMHKQPDQRFRDATEMAVALGAAAPPLAETWSAYACAVADLDLFEVVTVPGRLDRGTRGLVPAPVAASRRRWPILVAVLLAVAAIAAAMLYSTRASPELVRVTGTDARVIDASRIVLDADYDLDHFDPSAYLASAQLHARALLPDAELVAMRFDGVRAAGQMVLGSNDAFASYTFRSAIASRARARREGEPGNAPAARDCEVDVEVRADGIAAALKRSNTCDAPFIHPRCTAKQLYARAVADGMPADYATDMYWAFAGRSTIRVIADPWGEQAYPDDCQ